jgi:hypothetical protein
MSANFEAFEDGFREEMSSGSFFGPPRDDGIQKGPVDPAHAVAREDVAALFHLRLVVRHAPQPNAGDLRFLAVDL